jgi:hypothetical protein
MEARMNTKLTINLKEGILDVDGSEEFVRSIYDDFKGEVAKRLSNGSTIPRQIDVPALPMHEEEGETPTRNGKPKKARAKRSSGTGDSPKRGITKYRPTFDATLNVIGLPEFYDSMMPKTASERILVFAAFLRDQVKLEPCIADHIYTCFFAVKDRTKTPEAFVQAFHNTQSRTHWIDFKSLQDISITIPGNNRIEEMKKNRKAAA